MTDISSVLANLICRLSDQGIEVSARRHTVYLPFGTPPDQHPEALRLQQEFNFEIQYFFE